MGDVFSIFLLSLLAMFNPTLLAAVTVMMLLPEPRKLITGYLLGAYLTSIGLGLAIVFSLHNTASTESTKRTLSPLEDLVFGLILVIVGWVLVSGRATEIESSVAKRARRQSIRTRRRSNRCPNACSGGGRRASPSPSARCSPCPARPTSSRSTGSRS